MADIGERESVEYWKKQAKHYEQKALDIQQELDEYTENSAQLEKELEASLVQVEKQNRDLDNQNQRLKNEIESLKSKLERSQHEANVLEGEIQSLRQDKEKQAAYIRELEQKNDDLERGQRVISESVSYIEVLLNQAYERNAVLESEVDEVETLRVRLQRVTDEARDLKQELKVRELVPSNESTKHEENDNAISNGHISHAEDITNSTLKREMNGNTLPPSARISAINIVGELLRKVGLDRLLCAQCGKVRCACQAAPALEAAETLSCLGAPSGEDEIVYRRDRKLERQFSSGGDRNDTSEGSALSRGQNRTPERKSSPHANQNGILDKAFLSSGDPKRASEMPLSSTGNWNLNLSGSYRNETIGRPPSGRDQNRTLDRTLSPNGDRNGTLDRPPSGRDRDSNKAFVRAGEGTGKLRRSLVVRSREGLSNLLGLRAERKTQADTS